MFLNLSQYAEVPPSRGTPGPQTLTIRRLKDLLQALEQWKETVPTVNFTLYYFKNWKALLNASDLIFTLSGLRGILGVSVRDLKRQLGLKVCNLTKLSIHGWTEIHRHLRSGVLWMNEKWGAVAGVG